jgi:hypothetical protein
VLGSTAVRQRLAVVDRVVDRVAELPVLRQDAILYLMSGVFAAGESGLAITADYREWGRITALVYFGAAASCELVLRRRRRPGAGTDPDEGDGSSVFRRAVIFAVLAGAVLLPLSLLVLWRAGGGPVVNPKAAQAQPEVAVIERAGDRFAHFHNPYLRKPTNVGVSPSNDAKTVDAKSYFPYLPGMVPFGLTNAASVPPALADARLPLTVFTLAVVLLSLTLSRSSSRRRWRAFQFLVVLPTGALAVATGGDDLPVLALLLLGLVFLQRRQPVAAGIAMGLAGTLKWTAWPLILLGVLCARDEDEQRAIARYSVTVLLVAVPIIGAGAALDPHAFWQNVVAFPLGLTHTHSPAASPLPGQVLVQLFPADKRALTVALIAAGAVVVLAVLFRHPPREPSAAAWFAGWALAFATLIAPATRFGYFIYPANMFVWAYLLHDRDARHLGTAPTGPVPAAQLASSTW